MSETDRLPAVEELSVEAAHAMFDRRAREQLGISRVEFLDRLDADGLADYDPEQVAPLLTLLPFARARSRFRPSWLTWLMLAGLVLMLIGHLGRPTWYWIVLPAAAFGLSFVGDVKAFRRRRRR